MADVKGYAGAELSPFVQANKGPAAVFWMLLKTLDSWVRDKGQLTTHSHGNSPSTSICAGSWSSNSHRVRQEGLGDVCTRIHLWVVLQERNPKFREPQIFYNGQYLPSSLEGNIFFLIMDSKQIFPLLRKVTSCLSSKAVCRTKFMKE